MLLIISDVGSLLEFMSSLPGGPCLLQTINCYIPEVEPQASFLKFIINLYIEQRGPCMVTPQNLF
jgi:hypothetical protein